MSAWSTTDIGDLSSKVAIVTGASDGLGLATTAALVDAGAHVVMACRNETKAERARQTLSEPSRAEIAIVDLSNLASVRAMADDHLERHDRLDLLINNAGVMTPPPSLSADGVELQWATNHLGHFALTGLLVERLLATDHSRVVAVSSLAARSGRIRGYDPTSLQGYERFQSYANSKLANLVFSCELDRRLDALRADAGNGEKKVTTTSLAAHPGLSHTNLSSGFGLPFADPFLKFVSRLTAQPARAGSLPILRAATDPGIDGGAYLGPAGPGQMRGRAVEVTIPVRADDPVTGRALWDRSVELSQIDWLNE